MNSWKEWIKKLETYKYPLLIILIGIFLLLPTREEKTEAAVTAEKALEEVLADSSGVGKIRVLVSEKGAVVVCEGAANASVRLDILQAIGSYTGLGSDKITILRMSSLKGR